MRVSTRLTLTGSSIVLMVLSLAAVLESTTRAIRHELTKNEAAGQILTSVMGLRYLTLEYLLRHEERPQAQWTLSHQSLTAQLSSSEADDADTDVLSALRRSNHTVSGLFAELLQRHRSPALGAEASGLEAELDARLTAQIIVRLERMNADAQTPAERSRAGVLAAQRHASLAVVIVGAAIALAVILATSMSLRKVSRPLLRLREGAAIVGAGNLEYRLDLQSRDEIGDLGRAFNEMTARLRDREFKVVRAQQDLVQTQADLARVTRVATLGEITASIAHEINQPLGAIANNASAGLRWLAANELGEVRQSVERVVDDSHRASQIIARIRALLKRAPTQRERVDINEALEATVALTRGQAAKHGVELSICLSEHTPTITVDRVQIQQVVLNLIVNAIDAMRDQDEPRMLRVSSELDDADGLRIAVSDSGVGLAAGDPARIFEAFYTTKPDGIGMGLAVSRSIVEAHHGRLWATANPERGTTFHCVLPVGALEVS